MSNVRFVTVSPPKLTPLPRPLTCPYRLVYTQVMAEACRLAVPVLAPFHSVDLYRQLYSQVMAEAWHMCGCCERPLTLLPVQVLNPHPRPSLQTAILTGYGWGLTPVCLLWEAPEPSARPSVFPCHPPPPLSINSYTHRLWLRPDASMAAVRGPGAFCLS